MKYKLIYKYKLERSATVTYWGCRKKIFPKATVKMRQW